MAERRQRHGGWVRLQAVRALDHSATLSRFVWVALRSHELPGLVDDRVATRVGGWGSEVGRRELALRALRRRMFFRLGARRGAGVGDFLSQARLRWRAEE